eukprot:6249716-Pyramimonas_sp.AAC.1
MKKPEGRRVKPVQLGDQDEDGALPADEAAGGEDDLEEEAEDPTIMIDGEVAEEEEPAAVEPEGEGEEKEK